MVRAAFFLGMVQGVAEWLPISSSGHLVILRHFFHLPGQFSLDVFLHLASLLVIMIFFWKDIVFLWRALCFKGVNTAEFHLVINIILASFVTAAVALVLRPHEKFFSSLPVIGVCYLATGILLFFSRRDGCRKIDRKRALLIGLVQGLAVLPGLSRSGSTIATAIITGVNRQESFRFSFLLAIPAIAGAALLEARHLTGVPVSVLSAGFSVSFILGLVSLYLLKKIVVQKYLAWFGFYCLLMCILCFLL